MSYCRPTEKSRCYMIGTKLLGVDVLECCGCNLQGDIIKEASPEYKKICIQVDGSAPEGEVGCRSVYFTRRSEAIKHLRLHRKAGDQIPRYAFQRLKQELKQYGDYYSCEPEKEEEEE